MKANQHQKIALTIITWAIRGLRELRKRKHGRGENWHRTTENERIALRFTSWSEVDECLFVTGWHGKEQFSIYYL